MAGRGSKSAQQERTQAERARLHAARSEWHQAKVRRRIRDNVIACVGGTVLLIAAIASQVAHAQVVAPEPTPTSTVEPTAPAVTPEIPAPETPAPAETPAE